MQSVSEKHFFLVFKTNKKPKVLSLNQKLSDIILIARPLFRIPDEIDLTLKINGKQYSPEKTLAELDLKGDEELELQVLRLPISPRSVTTIYICLKDKEEMSSMYQWTVLLSDRLGEIVRAFCESKSLNPDFYTLIIDDQPAAVDLQLKDINSEQTTFVLKKRPENEDAGNKNDYLEEEQEFPFLTFLISGAKAEEYGTPVNWIANIRELKVIVTQDLGFPPNIVQRWNVDGQELDDEKPLKSQVTPGACIIIDCLFPILFNITPKNHAFEKTIFINIRDSVRSLKMAVETSVLIKAEDQIWSLNGSGKILENDQSLLSQSGTTEGFTVCVKDHTEPIKRTLSDVTKVFTFKYENKQVKKKLAINKSIEVIIQALARSFGLQGNTQLSLRYKDKLMDPSRSLDDYMQSNEESIIATLKEDQISSLLVSVIYKNNEKEFLITDKQSVKELKDQVCLGFKVEAPYLHSLSFESKLLKPSQILTEIENFGEDAVFELESMLEVKIINQTVPSLKAEIPVSPGTSISDLKGDILRENGVNVENYTLLLDENPLQEERAIDYYLKDNKEIAIVIKEKCLKNQIIIAEIPENHQYTIKEGPSEIFEDLKRDLETQCGVSSALEFIVDSSAKKASDVNGVEALHYVAQQVINQSNITQTEKNAPFEKALDKIGGDFKRSLDRTKESENLFQIVKNNCKACLTGDIGGLPDSQFPQDIDLSFDDYRGKLLMLVEASYKIGTAFEYTKQPPALIFKGANSDIDFTYLDLRRCFKEVEVEEFKGFPKANLRSLLNLSKIRADVLETTDLKSQETHVRNGFLMKLKGELLECGVTFPFELLEKYLDYHNQLGTPSSKFDDKFDGCAIIRQPNSKPDLEYDFVSLIPLKKKIQEYMKMKATFKSSSKYILSTCIDWIKITNMIRSELSVHTETKTSEIIHKIQEDLQRINLHFRNINEKLLPLCNRLDSASINITDEIVALNSTSFQNYTTDIFKQGFTYINQAVLKESLMTLSQASDSQYHIFARCPARKQVVKQEFVHIHWLNNYAKQEIGELFQNTIENKDLRKFIYREFRLKSLLEKIFQTCISHIKQFNSWNDSQLYQTVTRKTNDLIDLANSDLQQVSYCLDFDLVRRIHLSVAYLIWKFFEAKYWAKITEPLVALEGKKEQQRKYFLAMTASAHIHMNAAEAEKMKQY